jgi:hypothetical protein
LKKAYIPIRSREPENLFKHNLEVVVKPSNSLIESLLLSKFLTRLRKIAANSEAMLHLRKQIDLMRNLQLIQDLLTFMALGCNEDKIPNYKKSSAPIFFSGEYFI